MEVVTDVSRCPRPEQGTVVTIGAFDGVHHGHRVILEKVRRRAAELGAETAVITFDRHPATVVRPSSAPLLLTDLDQKLELLSEAGIDHVVVVTFDRRRANESAEDFVQELICDCLRARCVVVGRDFHFGHNRRGNVALLEDMGRRLGFEVVGLGLVAGEGEVVSSTRIRDLLSDGDVESANKLLERPHEIGGTVTKGDSRGGPLLGFPTANLEVAAGMLVPADGIYAGYVRLGDGHDSGGPHPAAVYVGNRPTFYEQPGSPAVEAYLLDFSGDVYGKKARVQFVARLRDDRRFDSLEDLAEQMERDVAAARTVLTG